jgi:tetratricopeptide (TPR) repeat protein
MHHFLLGLSLSALFLAIPAWANDPLQGTAAEKSALKSMRAEKYIRAREEAEKILRANPNSILGRYVLAEVFHWEEANLPRALYHTNRTEKLLTQRYGKRPKQTLAQQWHRRILRSIAALEGEMDKRAEQLKTIDRYDAIYSPKLDRFRIWPLMKLHRFDEAIAIAKKVTLSSRLETRISGYNGLLSIEFERKRPLSCYREAMRALEATAYRSCILNLNTAEAAFAVFRFDQVEPLAQKSLKADIDDCPSSAHTHLANLYLLRADFQRAISAVKGARQQGISRRMRQQFEMTITNWLMRLLFSLGKFDKAAELAERVVRSPDRVGFTSFSSELLLAIYTTDYHSSLFAEIERLKEKASARSFSQRISTWSDIQVLKAKAWQARHQATRLMGDGGMLVSLVRPYIKPMPPWSSPALISVAGEGVIEEAVKEAKKRVEQPEKTRVYFDVFSGEIAYRRGQWQKALTLARQILAALPKDEVLLSSRISAWGAKAAWQVGKGDLAAKLFHRVLHRWPTALRILSVALPVEILAGKDSLSQEIARRLERSPRLEVGSKRGSLGFKVRVVQRDGHMQICLNGPQDRRYACGVTDLKELKDKDEAEQAALAIDAFHDEVFTPQIDLTQQDINSLDGSAVRGKADQVLEEVLGK